VAGIGDENLTHYTEQSARNSSEDIKVPSAHDVDIKEQASRVAAALVECTPEINSWVKSEDSVMVHCRTYSSVALAIALLIVFGSISIPFLIQERMKGVDPFQWVTFAWLFAGAFLVGAKSRFDENWPWHDFLKGQILCQGVKQLEKVSGVDSQTILLYFLKNESKYPFSFRGPYKSIFYNCSSTFGFNIDVRIKHSTMLAAGFMLLKVTKEGKEDREYLLFEDIRDSSFKGEEERLVCELPRKIHKTKTSWGGYRSGGKLKFQKQKFSYKRALGQYAKEIDFE
jgi:hypothetical protein